MTTIVTHELPQRGQVFAFAGEEVEVVYVDFESSIEDGIIGLRRLHETRAEPMTLADFVAQQPELIVH